MKIAEKVDNVEMGTNESDGMLNGAYIKQRKF